jgi:hypothetical protein
MVPLALVNRRQPTDLSISLGATARGVGAGRFEVSDLIDALVRVQADQREADRRSLARAGQPGAARAVGNHQEWVAEEDPFLAGERPWERRCAAALRPFAAGCSSGCSWAGSAG